MDLNNVDTVREWDQWKGALKKAVDIGEAVGMSEDTMANIGSRIGNFLSSNVDPENREQRVLKELWETGNAEEKKTLVKMIARMVD